MTALGIWGVSPKRLTNGQVEGSRLAVNVTQPLSPAVRVHWASSAASLQEVKLASKPAFGLPGSLVVLMPETW